MNLLPHRQTRPPVRSPRYDPVKKYAAVILAMICFSLSFVWFKVANQVYGPLTIVFLRLGISVGIILVFLTATSSLHRPDKTDLAHILLLSFFEPFLYFMAESYGLRLLSPTVGAVIISMIPLVAPFAASFFLSETVTIRHISGIIVSFAGVTLVVYEIGAGMTASPLGILLQFGAVLSAVGYTVILRKISSRINAITILFYQSLLGTIYFLPFWLLFEAGFYFHTPFDTEGMLAIFKLAFLVSTVAFLFFIYSIRQLGITKSNMFINLVPVFTALFSWLILNELLTVQKMAGILIVILGLFYGQIDAREGKEIPSQ